jgi:hypothetical protein
MEQEVAQNDEQIKVTKQRVEQKSSKPRIPGAA